MSSKYGFENDEDRKKKESQRQEELSKELKSYQQQREEAKRIADSFDAIVRDILEDFVKATSWAYGEVNRYRESSWILKNPSNLPNGEPWPIFEVVVRESDSFLRVQFGIREIRENPRVGGIQQIYRLCEVLHQKTRLKVELRAGYSSNPAIESKTFE